MTSWPASKSKPRPSPERSPLNQVAAPFSDSETIGTLSRPRSVELSSSKSTPRLERDPFVIIPKRLVDAQVSDRAVRLYLVLRVYANPQGECWPSRNRLARDLRSSVSSVFRAVRELVALGVMQVVRRTDDRGDPTSNLYRLTGAVGVVSPVTRPRFKGDTTGPVTEDSGVVSPVTAELRSTELRSTLNKRRADDVDMDSPERFEEDRFERARARTKRHRVR